MTAIEPIRTGESEIAVLDPFAFWPDRASRISGIGGSEQGGDPDYVFHTPYVECPEGRTEFRLSFVGLAAETGTLILKINGLRGGHHVRAVAARQAQLRSMVRSGADIIISFEAKGGEVYAVLGHVYNADAVSATDLRVTVHTAEGGGNTEDEAIRQQGFVDAPRMYALTSPSFALPMCQACTPEQFDEPSYQAMADRLGGGGEARSLAMWREAILLNVLEKYWPSISGMRMARFGSAGDRVHALLTTAGAVIETAPPGTHSHELLMRQPDQFDLLWSLGGLGLGGTWREALAFVEDALGCVKVGGAVVSCFPLCEAVAGADGSDYPLTRAERDRILLMLISRGYRVAQQANSHAEPFREQQQDGKLVGSWCLIAFRLD